MKALLIVLAIYLTPSLLSAGEIGDWYKSLKVPGTGVSCCDISDCRRLPDDMWRVNEGRFEVLLPFGWVAVPENRVLARPDNPTGRPVLCASPTIVHCFVPGELS